MAEDAPGGNTADTPAAEKVPAWFPIAGVLFAGLTLVFFMALVILAAMSMLRLDGQPRFLIIVVFSLGAALSVTFLGGSAAASGKLPLPGVQDNPIQFSAGGGIATLIIVMILASLLFPEPKPPVGTPGAPGTQEAARAPQNDPTGPTAPEPEARPVLVDSCFYFNNGSFDFVITTPEVRTRQIAYVQNLIAAYGEVTVQGFSDEDTDQMMGGALSERRAGNVKDLLVASGIRTDRITTQAFGKSLPQQLPSDAFEAAYCRVQVVPGKPG